MPIQVPRVFLSAVLLDNFGEVVESIGCSELCSDLTMLSVQGSVMGGGRTFVPFWYLVIKFLVEKFFSLSFEVSGWQNEIWPLFLPIPEKNTNFHLWKIPPTPMVLVQLTWWQCYDCWKTGFPRENAMLFLDSKVVVKQRKITTSPYLNSMQLEEHSSPWFRGMQRSGDARADGTNTWFHAHLSMLVLRCVKIQAQWNYLPWPLPRAKGLRHKTSPLARIRKRKKLYESRTTLRNNSKALSCLWSACEGT